MNLTAIFDLRLLKQRYNVIAKSRICITIEKKQHSSIFRSSKRGIYNAVAGAYVFVLRNCLLKNRRRY